MIDPLPTVAPRGPREGRVHAALALVITVAALLGFWWFVAGGNGGAGEERSPSSVRRESTGPDAVTALRSAGMAELGADDAGSRTIGGGAQLSVRLRGPGRLVGTVRDRNSGAVVAGAEVRLLPVPPVAADVAKHLAKLVGTGAEFRARVLPVATTVTDAGGAFSFEGVREGRWFVDALTRHHVQDTPVEARVLASGSGGPVEIWMRAGGRVIGRVLRPDGSPAGDAQVSLTTGSMRFLEAASNGEVAMFRSRAESDGTFAFSGVAPGEGYEVAAIGDGFTITHVLGIDVAAGQDTEVLVQGSLGATIRGRVLSTPGASGAASSGAASSGATSSGAAALRGEALPLAGAKVAAMPRGLRHLKLAKEILIATHATTSEDGSYVLEGVPPGTVDVLAIADGHLPARGPILRVAAGRSVDAPDFQLERGPMVRGRVVDTEGLPVARARVMWNVIDVREVEGRPSLAPLFVAGMREFEFPETDADGRFVGGPFAGDPPFSLRVTGSGYEAVQYPWTPAPGTASVDGVRAPELLDEVEVILSRGGGLVGRVVDAATGEPVTSFSVRVSRRIETDADGPSRLNPFAGGVEVENPEGRFRLDAVASGEQTVTVEAQGYRSTVTDLVIVRDAIPAEQVIALAKGATIVGYVVDGSGEPVAGAQVTTEALVRATFDRFEDDRLMIEEGLSVRGRRRQRTPPIGFLRYAAALGLMGSSVVTSAPDGSFELTGLDAGTQEVLAFHRDYRAGATLADATVAGPGEPIQVVMYEGGGLRGVVSDRFGRPVPGATVIAMSPGLSSGLGGGPVTDDRAGANGALHQAPTDANGAYEIRHMEAGPYFLLATRGDENLSLMSFLGTLNLHLVSVPEDRVLTQNLVDTSASACRVHGMLLSGGVPRGSGILIALNLDAEGFLGVDFKAAPVENDGTYEFEGLAPGEYQITYESREVKSGFFLDVPDAPELRHDFELPSATVAGRLVDRGTRAPIADARMILTPLDRIEGPGLFAQVLASESGVLRRSTTADGTFVFDSLAEGAYRLVVERARRGQGESLVIYAPLQAVELDLAEDEELELGELELSPGVTVRGSVLDDTGRPVAGAEVLATSSNLARVRPRRAESDAEGNFVLRGLGPGSWDLTPNADGFATGAPEQIVLEEGGPATGPAIVQLELSEGVVVTCEVVDRSGQPRAGVACSLQRAGETAQRSAATNPGEFFQRIFTGGATTDARGRMDLGRRRAGTYELRASQGGSTAVETVELEAGALTASLRIVLE